MPPSQRPPAPPGKPHSPIARYSSCSTGKRQLRAQKLQAAPTASASVAVSGSRVDGGSGVGGSSPSSARRRRGLPIWVCFYPTLTLRKVWGSG